MKVKVTEEGLVVPKQFLSNADEVDIRVEDNRIVIVLMRPTDPILELGKDPVTCGIIDASENHDNYLYGTDS